MEEETNYFPLVGILFISCSGKKKNQTCKKSLAVKISPQKWRLNPPNHCAFCHI